MSKCGLDSHFIRWAWRLNRDSGFAGAWPPVMMMIETARQRNPVGALGRLPPRSLVVVRSYDDACRADLARQIVRRCADLRLVCLIAGDAGLALETGAAGVHLPERHVDRAPYIREEWPEALISAAAHSTAALIRAKSRGADCCVLGAIFETASHPEQKPMGTIACARLVRQVDIPVYAIGGITAQTIARLKGTGVAGVAGIGAFAPDAD